MAPAVLIALPIVAVIIIGAVFCTLKAGRLPVVVRIAAILPFVGVALFSVFGFLASGEPGVSPMWKVGYGIIFFSCLIAATRLAIAKRRVSQ